MNKINIFKRITIKRRFLIFSLALFLLLAVGGTGAFFLTMGQIIQSNVDQELTRFLEIKRLSLEASINNELAIVLKMADSPLITRFFLDPANPELEALAFEEIAGYRRAFKSDHIFWINDTDKKYYLGNSAQYVLDPAEPAAVWYMPTLNMSEQYEFYVDYEKALNKTVLWVNAPVRVQGKSLGIVGTGIELGDFIDSIYTGLAPGVSLYLFNAAGEITGARDSSLVVDKVQLGTLLKSEGAPILEALDTLRGTEISVLNLGKEQIALGRIPLLNWHITAFMTLTPDMYFNSSMTLVFAAILVVILLIFIIFNIFIMNVLKPLKHTMDVLKQISADWDLTRQLVIHSGDEFGELAGFFNITFGKIKELLTVIRNKADSLSGTGTELASNMVETAAAIDQITANIQNMEGRAAIQSTGVTETRSGMERIMASIDGLNEHILAQSDSVSQSSSAIEEMLANIRSVAQTLVKNTDNVNNLAGAADVGRSDVQKVAEDIQEIARESEGLLEINAVMENIASQTNLLSMNAAIEAAHAGEAGKGFAVVADEIRKLAESSADQSKTISGVLKKIKASIDSITQSTGVVIKRFEVIEQEVQTVSNQEAGICAAMEEQETGSRHILEAVTRLNELTAMVKQGSEEMTAEGHGVMRQSKTLEGIAAEMSNGMEEMAKGADKINTAIIRVNEISGENKTNIDALHKEVFKFKVE